MAFSRTPCADRNAAGMSAAGGDRHFAPGAAYRRGGFDETHWMREVNEALRELGIKPVHEVRPDVSLDGTKRWALCRIRDRRVTPLTMTLQPEHTSVQALVSMIDVNRAAIARAYRDELNRRAEEEANPPKRRMTPQTGVPKRRRVEEPEEAAAPGMRP